MKRSSEAFLVRHAEDVVGREIAERAVLSGRAVIAAGAVAGAGGTADAAGAARGGYLEVVALLARRTDAAALELAARGASRGQAVATRQWEAAGREALLTHGTLPVARGTGVAAGLGSVDAGAG